MSISNLALPGLSGYDFSSVIDMMVRNYSLPLNRMTDKKSVLETQKDAWRDVNTRLSSLENALDKLRTTTTWTGTSASSSNSEILSASGSAGAVKGTYNIKVLQTAAAQTVASDVQNLADMSASTALAAGSFEIVVGDKSATINVAAGASLKTIADSINNAAIGVDASVIKVEGGYRLALASSETGTEKAAQFTDVQGAVLKSLGVTHSGTLNISQEARNASLEINGISNISSQSNKVTTAIPGVTLNLNQENPGTTVIFKINADYSTAQAAVKSFVDQYNSTMSFIENKLIFNNETKVKGDLLGDPVLQSIQSRLRNMVSANMNNLSGAYKILADVGLSTSADNFGKSASLTFDTSKFNKALEENFASVANMFGADVGGVTLNRESSSSQPAQGLANIMKEYLRPMVMFQGTLDKTVNSYNRQIDQVKDEMEAFNKRLIDYAEKTRLKFSRLETQLSALSSESQWLEGQLNAMNAFNNSNKK